MAYPINSTITVIDDIINHEYKGIEFARKSWFTIKFPLDRDDAPAAKKPKKKQRTVIIEDIQEN